jgi:hypothetical protein
VISGEEARRLVLVSVIYTALTFVMAYPFSASPGSLVLADNPDTHLYLWTLAWDAHAFLAQPLHIFDANIYFPYANTLAYSENLIGSALFAAPVIWLTGDLVLAMNLVALLSCVLCGAGAYLLARRWHLSPPAAFLCGLIFAFAPPRFVRMGQLHMTAVQWIPFALAFLQGYLEHGRRRDLLLALGCLSLQVLSSGHGAAFLAIATVLLIAWRTAFGAGLPIRKWLSDCGATGAYFLAPSVLVMLPYLLAQREAGLRRGYSAEAMPGLTDAIASPSHLHMVLQRATLGRIVNDEAIAFLFPGILAIVLALWAVVRWRPDRQRLSTDATGYFLVLALVALAMFVTWPIELWRYVYWLPGFNFIRVPSRFILIVILSLGMLAATAFEVLTRRLSGRKRIATAAITSVLFLAEYSSHPFAGVPFAIETPAVDRWLETQPAPVVVAEVPVPSRGDLGAYERHHTASMLHATAHWHKTVHGYSGIRRPLHERLYEEMTAFPDEGSITSLREVGVTHVIVHTDRFDAERWRDVESRLAQSPDLELIHTDGAGRVYSIRRR